MPTYEYQCPLCEQIKEVTHSIAQIDNPSKETMKEISCTAHKRPVKMMRYYGSAPAIATMTASRISHDANINQKVKADRKKRNAKHFKNEVYPTLPKSERKYFTKKHGLKQ